MQDKECVHLKRGHNQLNLPKKIILKVKGRFQKGYKMSKVSQTFLPYVNRVNAENIAMNQFRLLLFPPVVRMSDLLTLLRGQNNEGEKLLLFHPKMSQSGVGGEQTILLALLVLHK